MTKCYYCFRKLIDPSANHTSHQQGLWRTKDHTVPASAGGRKTVPCCRACNSIKGNMSPKEWRDWMQSNPNWWADNWQWTASQVAKQRAFVNYGGAFSAYKAPKSKHS